MAKQITIRMPKADLEMVLAMLRNPVNAGKQGKHALFDGNGYCCLGAMQCAKTGGKVEHKHGMYKGLPSYNWLATVGWEFTCNEGRRTADPWLPALHTRATFANDSKGYTFAQIADAIEDCAEGY